MSILISKPFNFEPWQVSFPYGPFRIPGTNEEKFHKGVDIARSIGTDIRSGIDGMVTLIGCDPKGYGLYLCIESDGVKVLYAHCEDIHVSIGETVQEGDIIAALGSSGETTGPHVHFEVWINGVHIDPISVLK